jgi:hypothetical protein
LDTTKLALVITTIGSIIAFVLLKGPEALNNIQILPDTYSTTESKVKSVYYNDKYWSGIWSANTEYDYTSEEGDTSNTDIVITMGITEGKAFGSFYSKSMCDANPVLDFLLLDGEVNMGTLYLTGYEMIGGKRQNFLHLKAYTDSDRDKQRSILSFETITGMQDILPKNFKLTRQPEDSKEQQETTKYCLPKRFDFFKKLIEQANKVESNTAAQEPHQKK